MEKFKVCIEERVSQEFEIEAMDEEEAEEIAREKYNDGEFVVNGENVTCRMIAVVRVGEDYSWFNEL